MSISPSLPVGTVTFLFTDIEGSTALWEEHPEAMSLALARHDALLHQTVEENGGCVFKTVGDAFYTAFATAPDALAAALAAQQRLVEEGWNENLRLRVRMALHTGIAEERGGDYYGTALNRTARLLGVAHGGQVLVSHITQELALEALPPGVTLQDLGRHRLKDLGQAETIFQLAAPALPDQFPPLASLDARPNNLPVPPTPLLGREKEVAEVCRLLRDGGLRLLTLTGPGGTGKTRLSLQASAELLEDFPDGAFFVSLAAVRNPANVVATIAQTLSLPETTGQTRLQALRRHLQTKRLLLVLDNFEQVVGAAPDIADLLSCCPGLKTLVTSRVTLHVRGEQEFPVPPLALPQRRSRPSLHSLSQYGAVQLFLTRAQAVQPDFAITNENAPAVAEICWRLDGLPLALELAAARIKLLPPSAMLARLENRLGLLTGGSRDLPARHQTLRNAIIWSYDLLDPAEQALLRSLAVFAGGCTLEAAEAVCDPVRALGLDVLDGLGSLLDKSLLQRQEDGDGSLRFVLLETVREFALEQLEQHGEAEAAHRRQAEYFHRKAIELFNSGDKSRAYVARCELWYGAERDNLLAALKWLASDAPPSALELGLRLSYSWQFTHDDIISLNRRALASSEQAPVTLRIPMMVQLAGHIRDRDHGQSLEAKDLLDEALALAQTAGEWHEAAVTRSHLAMWMWYQGDFAAARAGFEECRAFFEAERDQYFAANTKLWSGRCSLDLEEYDLALKTLEETLAESREHSLETVADDAVLFLGVLHFALKNHLQATEYFQSLPQDFSTLGWLSRVWQRRGDPAAAERLARQSVEINRDYKTHITPLFYHLANDALDQENPAAAQRWLTQAWGVAQDWDDAERYIACLFRTSGRLAAVQSQPERAALLWGAAERCEAVADAVPLPVWATRYDFEAAQAACRTPEFASALSEGRALPTEKAIQVALTVPQEEGEHA